MAETPKPCYGIVLCGGYSTRMKTDKAMLSYHRLPQCYNVYNMLQALCESVFISCRLEQVSQFSTAYSILPDLPEFNNIGPMAGVLTAFSEFPERDILLMGVDYPLIETAELKTFFRYSRAGTSAAFFNNETGLYDPMLAFYHKGAAPVLLNMFYKNEYSLRNFLTVNKARAYCPENFRIMQSVDTPEAYLKAMKILNRKPE